MTNEEIKRKQLSAYLNMIYQSGFAYEHPQLFDNEPLKEIKSKTAKESIKFYKLIKEESIKRGTKHQDLIEYFIEHKEELIKLLKYKKVVYKKFLKIYEHAEMEKIKSEILTPGWLVKIGSEIINEDYASGNFDIYERIKDKNIQILYKFLGKPKLSVSQLKNIYLCKKNIVNYIPFFYYERRS